MPRTKRASKSKSQNASIPVFGAVGVSLSLAGGASDATAAVVDTKTLGIAPNHEVTLNEEEVADVSLATFNVFDKEKASSVRPGVKLAMGGGCGNCAGCAACAGCWSGTYYTSSVVGGDPYPPPPPPRPVHRHIPRKP